MEERKKEKRKDRKLDIQRVCPVKRNSFVNIKWSNQWQKIMSVGLKVGNWFKKQVFYFPTT